ncbi:MAG: ABC transporter substrate-binding protein [Acidimicrobiia bacterium]
MRARLWLVVGVTLAVVLGACSGGGGSSSSSGSAGCPLDALDQAKGPVTITFWHVQTRANLDELKRQTNAFNASQSKVRVKLVDQTGYKESLQKYRAGLSNGDLPDLAQFEETSVQTLLDSKSTVTMQDCVTRDHYKLTDFIPRTISYYTVGGKLRALPWPVSNPILIYNKDAFRRAGLDPDKPPATLDEVREMSRTIVATRAAKYGIALRTQDYFNEFFYAKAGQAYVNNDGGRKGRATKALLDNPTGKRIWTWWKDMVGSGLAFSTGSVEGNFDHLLAVGTGDAAMSIDASGALGPILQVVSSGQYPGVTIGAGPLPSLRPGGGVPVGDGSLWISNRIAPAKQAAAWEFAKYLEAPEQQAALAAATGYVPVRQSAVRFPEVQAFWAKEPAFRVPYDQLLKPGGRAANGSVIGNYQGVRDAVRDGLTAMLTQGKSVDDALADAQRNADAAIQDYNARVAG